MGPSFHFLAWKQRPLTFKGDSATLSLTLFLAKETSFSESSFSLAISRMREERKVIVLVFQMMGSHSPVS